MATIIPSTLERIDEQFLTCTICLERYKHARVLPCQHTFCEKCLTSWVKQHGGLNCAVCRQPWQAWASNIQQLPPSLLINGIVRLLEERDLKRVNRISVGKLVRRKLPTACLPWYDYLDYKQVGTVGLDVTWLDLIQISLLIFGIGALICILLILTVCLLMLFGSLMLKLFAIILNFLTETTNFCWTVSTLIFNLALSVTLGMGTVWMVLFVVLNIKKSIRQLVNAAG
ncbi:uncharacterized protein LOC100370213 [Saccoglossus kowalevskii]|uniref:Uncharacterized protein LOC100370213 n=1 Tax=Saccoglossus kowalevskii TaxID=10224 RepID=A0ABM0GQV1_SACKO|nr:PREDICTED: uncharacterized protein LOC100370213 [Saccoglossus kowalevskii]